MSRYRILLNKRIPTWDYSVSAEEEKVPVKDIPGRVKELQRWDDRFISVIKEISPRKSTCRKCRKKIDRGTPRYSCYDNRCKYSHQGFFHLRCLLPGMRKFIREYPKRDFAQEAADRVIERIILEMDQFPEADKYTFLNKIGTFTKTVI